MRSLLIGLLAAAVLTAPASRAADYPTKPIKMIVPYPAGGGTDVLGRLVAQKLSERLGEPILVENRTGASGSLGTELVVRSPPDGYTLLFNNETLAIAPNVSRNLPYDVLRDLTPIGWVAKSVIVIGVASSLPAQSLRDLIAMAKKEPGKLSYSSCGNDTMMHFAGEMLKQAAGVDMVHVPYRGCGPAIQDSLSGQVPVFFNALTNAVAYGKQGRVRVLAVASGQRTSLAPDIPTVAEQGFPGYEASPWQALFAPAGVPEPIVARLSTELRQVVTAADVSGRIRSMSFEPVGSSPAELGAMVRSEVVRWGRVAKAAGIEPQ
jgi:tripartite-type tricarboxylate transporter receptor subunit TctC